MIKKINHIGILVRDIEKGMRCFTEGLGMTVEKEVTLPSFNSKIAFIPCGNVMIELVQPLGPGRSMDYLNIHGEGLHHICFDVEDLHETYEELGEKQILREDGINIGAEGKEVFFIKPESLVNVLAEFTTEE